jgi:hypothetical protein
VNRDDANGIGVAFQAELVILSFTGSRFGVPLAGQPAQQTRHSRLP